MAGLLPAASGHILIDGQPVDGPGRDRGLVLPQHMSFGWLRVQWNMAYRLRLLVTHDVAAAVYLTDTVHVLSARPARILHLVDAPAFADRSLAPHASVGFRRCEEELLGLLYAK